MSKLSVSILDVKNKENIDVLNNTNTDYIHVDIMDGEFVLNKKDDYHEFLSDVTKPLDIHIMANNPKKYIDDYLYYDPKYITIHYEVNNLLSNIEYIKKNNILVGVAIKPNTNIEKLYPILGFIDLVLIMSVEPGLGGQKFINGSLNKIKELKDYINKNNYDVVIEVDGGVNGDNFKEVINSGSDIIVVGSYITKSSDYLEKIKYLKEN